MICSSTNSNPDNGLSGNSLESKKQINLKFILEYNQLFYKIYVLFFFSLELQLQDPLMELQFMIINCGSLLATMGMPD